MMDFTNKKFGVISLGCDKNRVDAEKLMYLITSNGCKITENIDEANVLIINTCAFLQSAREEAIDTILEFSAYKLRSLEKIVVTGCLPQLYSDYIFDDLIEVDVLLGIRDYSLFFIALEQSYLGERVNLVAKGNDQFIENRVVSTPQHYAYLKIADGCNNCCTYCLIPKIRGRYVSYPIECIIEEASRLGELSELILVAQDVTRYGMDLYKQPRLVELIQHLSLLENIVSIRLLYCYPDMIDDNLIAEFKNNPKLIKYIDIPLQHSEDRVLKLMNRKGNREQYLALIEKLKNNIPNIAIRSTFICGFPTETQEEFEGMKSFIRQARLVNCGFFAYSREEGTLSYNIKGQIKANIKKARVNALYRIQQDISREYLSQYVGKKIRVLCDGIDYERQCFVGRAYYSAPDIDGKVYFNGSLARQGEYYDVLIKSADSYDVYGVLEDLDE